MSLAGRRRAAKAADARRVAVMRHAGLEAQPTLASERAVAKALVQHRTGQVMNLFPSMARLNIGTSWAKSIANQSYPRGTRP